uniref:Uncharacterized protein n=1 Tax=Cupriavidus taiwanensis TaxID=164546 RepID=A0A375HD07_9BURK|nr:protein of unknown function [Cupriavidus taiwanensis]
MITISIRQHTALRPATWHAQREHTQRYKPGEFNDPLYKEPLIFPIICRTIIACPSVRPELRVGIP